MIMPKKKDNIYSDADAILDFIIDKSGLSQNKFSRDILGIAGGNVSDARKTGKIPDRWFSAVDQKLGMPKSEIIAMAMAEQSKTLSEIEYAKAACQRNHKNVPATAG